jgi:hypothetical protein
VEAALLPLADPAVGQPRVDSSPPCVVLPGNPAGIATPPAARIAPIAKVWALMKRPKHAMLACPDICAEPHAALGFAPVFANLPAAHASLYNPMSLDGFRSGRPRDNPVTILILILCMCAVQTIQHTLGAFMHACVDWPTVAT